MSKPDTIVGVIRDWSQVDPDRTAYVALADGETELPPLSRTQVDKDSRAIARMLTEITKPGDRAFLLYTSGTDFVTAFYGCLYAGVLAVPVYPPDPRRLDRSIARLRAITRDARPSVILTTKMIKDLALGMLEPVPELASLPWRSTDDVDRELAEEWRDPCVSAESIAFLQYTSGSTGAPKGVCVTHANLIANTAALSKVMNQASRGGVAVSWLPMQHDMGLIGTVLMVPFMNGSLVLMDPMAFLKKPVRWLRAISHYGARGSGGPCFAYELCVRKIPPEDRVGLDLSSWDFAALGAEPIRADTLARFAAEFAPFGFRSSAFWPFFGLAEATLAAASRAGDAPTLDVRSFDGRALSEGRAVETTPGPDGARTLVGHGGTTLGLQARIVDPKRGAALPDAEVGEIWLSGTSIAAGYWGRPEESAEAFGGRLAGDEGRWYKTGDLGFIHAGQLYLTGRSKDLIIISGRNLYPQDVEQVVEGAHPQVRKGCVAAFGIEAEGTEQLAVIAEINDGADHSVVSLAIREALGSELGVDVQLLRLVGAGEVLKTPSGKLQRSATKEAMLDKEPELSPTRVLGSSWARVELEAGSPLEVAVVAERPEPVLSALRAAGHRARPHTLETGPGRAADVLLLVVDAEHSGDPMQALASCRRLAWTQTDKLPARRVVVATYRGIAPSPEAPVEAASAAVWGYLRALRKERPELQWCLRDLDDDRAFGALARTLAAAASELSLRGAEILAPSLAPLAEVPIAKTKAAGGAALLFGPLDGPLGPLARWLIERRGAERLILVGAGDLPPPLAEARARGVSIELHPTANEEGRMVETLSIAGPALRWVGCAPVGAPAALAARQSLYDLKRTLVPGLDGLRALDRHTRGRNLASFFAVCPAETWLGSAGASAAAALAAAMEAVVHERRRAGESGSFVAWGPSEVGRIDTFDGWVAEIRKAVATALAIPAEQVPVDRPLDELAFDSLALVELKNALIRATGEDHSARLVTEHPTVRSLAAAIHRKRW